MSKEKNPSCPRVDIGGQAVMEGVMMKAPRAIAVSVRRPDKTIVTKLTPYTPITEKHKWMGWPIIRGVVNFVHMLFLIYTFHTMLYLLMLFCLFYFLHILDYHHYLFHISLHRIHHYLLHFLPFY